MAHKSSRAIKVDFNTNSLSNTQQPVGHVPKDSDDLICTIEECAMNGVEMPFSSRNVLFLVQFAFYSFFFFETGPQANLELTKTGLDRLILLPLPLQQ